MGGGVGYSGTTQQSKICGHTCTASWVRILDVIFAHFLAGCVGQAITLQLPGDEHLDV